MKITQATVYIVDDDDSFRKSLRRLISAMGFNVIDFDSALTFLEISRLQRPACLVLDFNLPKMDGLGLQEELIVREITLPIIFITGQGSIPVSVKAMKKGAIDFLQKPFSSHEISLLISQAIALDDQNRRKEKITKEIKSFLNFLTPREQEVLRWVVTGRPSKQIASKLGTTEKTIRVHRGRIMKKMHANSVADLVRSTQLLNITPPVSK